VGTVRSRTVPSHPLPSCLPRDATARPRDEVPRAVTTSPPTADDRLDAALHLPAPRRGGLLDSLPALRPAGDAPLHLQLRTVLDLAVAASGLAHGDRIWSESQLTRHYEVSRHVVRQALNQLVLEGRLSVRKGAGYYVNRRRVVKQLAAGPGDPAPEPFAVELLGVGVEPAEGEEAALAARPQRPRVHRVRRLGRIDGEPVALLTGAYPTSLSRVLTRPAVSADGVHATLAAHGRRPVRSDAVLGMTFASTAEAALLGVAGGAPLVCIRSRARTGSGELVEVTRELYRGDRFEFSWSAGTGPAPADQENRL
jgi:GntR family transcriptional regulator